MRNQDPDSLETPERTEENNNRSHKGSIDKVIHIETCRNCQRHRHSTWHDEAKYDTQFTSVKAAIEELIPGIQVLKNQNEARIFGGFEIMHGEKVLFSKKTSGLWPNAKAVAQRVQMYFDDLAQGKDVSGYGTQPEKAYTPPRQKGDRMSYTSGVQELNVFNPKYAKTDFSPSNDLQKQGSESSPKRDENENENENELASERRENEGQNNAHETNKVEEKEQQQEDKEDKGEQVNNHHENTKSHEEHDKHENHDNPENLSHNPHEHTEKEQIQEQDVAHAQQHENKESHEHNNHQDNAQHENKASEQDYEQDYEQDHEQPQEQVQNEKNDEAEQKDPSPTIPEKKVDEERENEVVNPKEGASQDHPMAFMFGAMKGKVANITK